MGTFKDLTPDNGVIKTLKELIQMTTFKDESLESLFTLMTSARNGKKLGFIGDMEDVGTKLTNRCNPTYVSASIDANEKEWELGEWEIPLKLCYEDIMGTVAEYTLRTGTDKGDMTSIEYMNVVYRPALENAMINMMWRLIWFGDKDANNITGGSGQITDGVNTNLFTVADGFWKRLFAIITDNESQKTAIAANSQTTAALQKSKLLDSGVATGIVDSMLMEADPRISTLDGAAIFMTKSLADALTQDVKKTYSTIMPWEVIFDGVQMAQYNGVPIYSVSIWDRMIKKYQNDKTKLNIPHRAVYTSPKNLLVGAPGELISDLDIFFNREKRQTQIYSTGDLGTLIAEDELVQVAC